MTGRIKHNTLTSFSLTQNIEAFQMNMTMTTMTEVEEGETDSIRNVDIAANHVIDNSDEGAFVESNRPYIQVEPVKSGKYLCKMIKLPLTELEARLSAMKELKFPWNHPLM